MLVMDRRTFFWMGLGCSASLSPIAINAIITPTRSTTTQARYNSPESAVFYVAPNGNDSWSGTLADPDTLNADGPFATLEKAQEAVRSLKRQQNDSLDHPVTVYVRGGTYFLGKPLVFSPEDSGTEDFPVTYAGYENETPIISGGRQITGWQPVTVNGQQLFKTTLPKVRQGKWFFRQLWVNGQRRDRARHPNKGYLEVAEVPDANRKTPWSEGQKRFRFQDGDLKDWQTLKDAEVVVMTKWLSSRLSVTEVDEQQNLVSFSKTSTHKLNPGNLYYLENALEILDTPGEWYLSRTRELYYKPLPDENLEEAEVIAGIRPRLIRITGDPAAEKFVEHLEFRGLTFLHSESNHPDRSKYSSAAQGARNTPGAVYLKGARHCTFSDCSFSQLESYAVELAEGCQYNRLAKCEIFELGAGGIKIRAEIRDNEAEQSFNNEITDCHIHHLGNLYKGAVGIWVGQSYDNLVARNHIHDCYYTAISVGETWGYERSLANNNVIELNHIHHIGWHSDDGPLLNDKGGIYTVGVQPGTVIRSNLIYDIDAFDYGGWGIYLDAGSSQITVENNLVYQTRDGGFHLHYGKENTVRNNIFAFGKNAQIRKSARTQHLSLVFEQNIVYWTQGKLLEGKWRDFNFEFNNNLYWQENNQKFRFDGFSWREWQAKGMDTDSLITSPLFVAPERGIFLLQPNSPAYKLGFERLTAADMSIFD